MKNKPLSPKILFIIAVVSFLLGYFIFKSIIGSALRLLGTILFIFAVIRLNTLLRQKAKIKKEEKAKNNDRI